MAGRSIERLPQLVIILEGLPEDIYGWKRQLQDLQGGTHNSLSYWEGSQQLATMNECDLEIKKGGSLTVLLGRAPCGIVYKLTVQPRDR